MWRSAVFRNLLLVTVLAALPMGGCGTFTPSDNATAVVRIPKANLGAATYAPASEGGTREWYRVAVTGPGLAPVAVTGEVDGAAVRLTDLAPGAPRYFTAELFADGALKQKTHAGVSSGVTLVAGETTKVTIDVRSLHENRLPSLAAAVIADGTYYTDSVITCEPQGFADADGDAPQYRFAWLVNGADAGVAAESIAGDAYAKGDTVRCRVTPFDGLAEGAPVESNEVTIVNSPPTVAVSFINGPYFVTSPLTPFVSPVDADGDAVSLMYAWAIGTEPQMVTSATLSAGAAIRGQTVTVTVTASDGAASSAAVSANVVIANSKPVLAGATLDVTAPATGDIISVTPGAASDADAFEVIDFTYQWYVNGLPVVGQTFSSLDGTYFDRFDQVYVLVTPTDGIDAGLPVASDTAVVVNTPPAMASVTFTPTTVYEASNLVPNPVGFVDADGDAPAYWYTWYVNGIGVSNAFSINGASFDKGDTVWVEVKPFDGSDYGAYVTSATAVVQNSKPYISWVYFQQTLYTETTAEVGLTLGDDDLGDTLTYEYQWWVDGSDVTGWQSMHILNGSYFDKNQLVTALVRIYDGTEYSDVVSESTTVLNSAPAAGAYSLAPVYTTSGTTPFVLQVDVPAFDADGDALTFMVDAYKNGVYVTSNSALSFTVATLPREEWHAEVAVYDGEVWATPVPTANTVVIAQTAVQADIGLSMACARTQNNDLECWGDGYLGRGSYETQLVPVTITAFSADVSSVSVGSHNTCAIKTDNTLWCWGMNSFGEAGQGTTYTPVPTPTQVPGIAAKSVSVGRDHACAATTSGALYCWGSGSAGQLGQGSTSSNPSPGLVSALSSVTQVSAGHARTCAVVSSGDAYCWGQDPLPAVGGNQTLPALVSLGAPVAQISAGATHVCAVTDAPALRCWGENAWGQLGDGTFTRYGYPVTVSVGFTPLAVAAGNAFTCAAGTAGAACWGASKAGSLGDGAGTASATPVGVMLSGTMGTPAGVDAGEEAACLTLSDGALFCWGFNRGGTLGRGVDLKLTVPVASGMYIEALAANNASICTLWAGDTWCWGKNNGGQFGTGGVENEIWEPVMSSGGLASAADLSLGNDHLCTLRADQSVWCSGKSFDGQAASPSLGMYQLSATPVLGLSALDISMGYDHSCAVRTDGKVACWGKNDKGQLGDGSVGTSVTMPVEVTGVTNAVAVSAGFDHTCAVTDTGALYCWGGNFYGALGNGDNIDQSAPVQVFASGVQAVEASDLFTCAIKTDFTVWCWGLNSTGSLGNGTYNVNASTPQQVSGGFMAKALSSAGAFVCAIDLGDDVYCWGSNINGELGVDVGDYYSMVPAGPVVQDVEMLAAATQSACAFDALSPPFGTLYCWGYNEVGQLRDPATLTPAAVAEYWASPLAQ